MAEEAEEVEEVSQYNKNTSRFETKYRLMISIYDNFNKLTAALKNGIINCNYGLLQGSLCD